MPMKNRGFAQIASVVLALSMLTTYVGHSQRQSARSVAPSSKLIVLTTGLSLLGAGLSFLFLAVLFWPLEKVFPAKPQRLLRPNWWTDLAFFLGQYLVWRGGVLVLLHVFRGWLDGVVPAVFREAVISQPWWLQAVEVIVLSDLLVYW